MLLDFVKMDKGEFRLFGRGLDELDIYVVTQPASQASEALRPAWLALRPDWQGLRPTWLALGPSRGG